MKFFSILVVFVILTSKLYSQYSTGFNDGFSSSNYNPLDYLEIYAVGNDDGFSTARFGSLNNEVPLPIVLVKFEAECLHKTVCIKWETASEMSNDFFTVERSNDGVNWLIVGIIDGSGNSFQNLSYSLIDFQPINGVSYYRLKQTDFNGQFEYSNVLSVNCSKETIGNIVLYPNPVSNELIIDVAENKSVLHFEITNILGITIYKGKLESKTLLQTSSFHSGIYIIRFSNGEAVTFIKK
jgi:hypothetical protein